MKMVNMATFMERISSIPVTIGIEVNFVSAAVIKKLVDESTIDMIVKDKSTWIPDSDGTYTCKNCGTNVNYPSVYCPHCGNTMDWYKN